MEAEDEEEQSAKSRNPNNNKKVVIQIPSYKEVIESSQQRQTQASQSLFKPSQSFSQAFSYIKNTEFYAPPPAPSTPSPPVNVSENASSSRLFSNSWPIAQNSVLSAAGAAASSSSQTNQNRNAILVSNRQKGNPLLKHIRNVKWVFADVVCDYLVGQSSCALYLSLRYHLLHPDYLYYRIRELPKNYKLRVVLCHVDVEDAVKPLLTKTALLHDCTLLCAWSLEECGRYLETLKMYENKPADLIQGQMDTDYLSRLNHALTSIRHVNKTDVVTFGSTFGSLSNIMDASMEDLARCPGIGERKVKRLHDTFHEPFKRAVSSYPVAETPVQESTEPSSANENTEAEKEDANKRRKKEPELTVKSALSAAFAKYADKAAKRNNKSQGNKAGDTSDSVEREAENRNSNEGAAS